MVKKTAGNAGIGRSRGDPVCAIPPIRERVLWRVDQLRVSLFIS
jgi:hypothetical protein